MNHAQKQVVLSGAAVAVLLGVYAVKELSRPGASCKDDMVGWIDGRGRWVQAKSRTCE